MLLCLSLTACSEDPDVEPVPPTSEGRINLDISSDSSLFDLADDGKSGNVRLKQRGGSLAIDIVTNASGWSFTTTDGEWLDITVDSYFLYLKAEANSSESRRSATITITATEQERSTAVTLYVSQNSLGSSEISLATTEHNFEAHTSLTTDVLVECSGEEWSTECTCSWLLVEREGNTLRLTADDNRTNLQRSTKVRVTTGEGNNSDSDTITVTQDGNAFITLSSKNMATDDDGGKRSISFSSNPELERSIANASGSWFKATLGDSDITITVESNIGGNQRFGSVDIVVGDDNNSATATIHIHQIGPDTEALIYEVEIPEPEYTLTAAPVLTTSTGGSITVDWGDGSKPESFESRRGTHLYHTPGLYTITITGEARSLKFGNDDTLSTELRNVISWGKLGYTTAADMCLGCSRLESIPNDVAGSFAGVKSFLGAFSCCESLEEIPAGLFRHATVAKNFEDCFSHSASISEIPAGLFDNCTAAEDFSYAFYATGTGIVSTNSTLTNFEAVSEQVRNGRLKSLPAALFAKCPNIKQLDYAFGATALNSIPEDLFATSSKATKLTGAFSACVLVESIPEGLMLGATAATDIKYMFAGCSSLRAIPTGIFVNNATVTNLEYIFYKTGVSTLNQGIFEGLTGVKTIGAVFQDCKSLTTIEEGVFDGLTSAKSFRYCFADCTALRTIPEGLLRNLNLAYEFTYMFHNTALESVPAGLFNDARDYSSADFTYMFSECPNLKTVPASLFDTFTKVTSPGFKNLFDNAGIETIPAGLFANNVQISSGFESVFENCLNLKTIEGSIFPTTTTVSSIAYAFCNCPQLESIPEDLFAPFGDAKLKFTATFAGCKSLKSIPAGLFASNPKVKQFSETFADCSSLESIPEGLLSSCADITTVKGMFHGCTSLKAIPAGLFANNPSIQYFERTFAECSSLESIPEGLFSAIGTKSSSITFSECFAACSSLTSVPTGLFDTVRRINYIDGCFEDCIRLEGESPYTIITLEDGTEQKVHLYERERDDNFPIVPSSNSAHEACFSGCKKLSDYYDMPVSWR